MHRLVVALTVIGWLFVPGASLAKEGDRPFPGAKSAFRKALRSKTADERARAFDFLRDRTEVAAVGEICWGIKEIQKRAKGLKKKQKAAIKGFDDKTNKIEAAKKAFRDSDRGPKDIERFNKATRKLEKDMAKARREIKQLENEWIRERALEDSATRALASVLTALPEGNMEEALGFLRESWTGESSTPDDHVRWVESLTEVNREEVTNELFRALNDGEASNSVRVAAMDALARRRHGETLGRAMGMLKLTRAYSPLISGAIHALTIFHDRRGIVPLIGFLGRMDIGRLRGDAHAALKSLTGEKHGPYMEPWQAWWEEHQKDFKMPPEPVAAEPGAKQKEGVTFYGIQTFSDRVLFVVDVSASMDWALGGQRGEPGGEKAKMVTARKELSGAVYNLPNGGNFNVILFNHEVLPWQTGVVTVSESTKKKCERWINSVPPAGLTNIHDALELAFRLVFRTTGEPDFDTIFFLTDGKPTAGKVQQADQILARVKEWVQVSQTQIHVVGIGGDSDIDEAFLTELAKIGRGDYARRGG